MATEHKTKKRIVTSYKNLSEELKEEVKRQYPNGYTDSMLRIDKGPGDFFYAIMLETPDTSYLIKVDVKIDDEIPEDDDDKDYYDDDIKGADDLANAPDDSDED